jgi:hypothetical protein
VDRQRRRRFVWKVERGARGNYRLLGQQLAQASDSLYRNGANGHGLLQVLPDGTTRLVTRGPQLAPLIADTLLMIVTKGGKTVSELPAAGHLAAMLQAGAFLDNFRVVDQLARTPLYRDDYSLLQPGYNDFGAGGRILYLGPKPVVSHSMDTIRAFQAVMPYATEADRTNATAAALTVVLRNFFRGAKPVISITATRSHAGKGTVCDFIRGAIAKADILYECTDWPMTQQFQRQLHLDPEIRVIVLDNVRVDSSGGRAKFIRSAFLESFVTMPELILGSPGGGNPIRLQNELVVLITTNDGSLSPDLLNRSLPIHLAPKGDVRPGQSPIGNPKLEFLPTNREKIQAELLGMIARWKEAGCPLDEAVVHPMSHWARTVGGIVKQSGFSDFLANYDLSRTVNDPTRQALSLLAAARPGKELRPKEWAQIALDQSLVKDLIPANERDSEKGRERAIGVVLKRHLSTEFEVQTDRRRLRVRLDGGFRRWVMGGKPHTRYIFAVLEEQAQEVEGPAE